jgi:hypothetical protein
VQFGLPADGISRRKWVPFKAQADHYGSDEEIQKRKTRSKTARDYSRIKGL